jgi:hypothetical protein
MNIYFLVEGETERKIYKAWLQYLIPELQQVKFSDRVERNNYFLVSGEGYPAILSEGIPNAIERIQESQKYQYLVICTDADEDTVEEREQQVNEFIRDNIQLPDGIETVTIVQNRCIETWFLGNRKMFDSRQCPEGDLAKYVRYYDVSRDDPELMGRFDRANHAEFHEAYLKEIFQAKKQTYSKKLPGVTQEKYYLDQLIQRSSDPFSHLKTFKKFIDFCARVRQFVTQQP